MGWKSVADELLRNRVFPFSCPLFLAEDRTHPLEEPHDMPPEDEQRSPDGAQNRRQWENLIRADIQKIHEMQHLLTFLSSTDMLKVRPPPG
jgi:hypothetical protein